MNIFYLFGGLLMLLCVAGAIGSGVILLARPPEWWAPPVPGQTEVYHHSLKPDDANRPPGSSLFEATLMTWNPKTGLVQFYWEAID